MFGCKERRKERLKELAKGACKPKEEPQFTVDGKITHKSEHGNEIVDGMLVMTNHRMLVVKKPIIGKKIDSFTYAQVDSMSVHGKDSVSLCTPGEVFTVSGVKKEKELKEFVDEFSLKKKPKKATVEVAVAMKREDIKP